MPFSPESIAGSSEAEFDRSPFCDIRGESQIVDAVFELARSKDREETGRLSPPQSVSAFRLSSMVIGRCVPGYI